MIPILNPELAGYYKDDQGRLVRITRKLIHPDERVWVEYRLVSKRKGNMRLLKGLHRGFTDHHVKLFEAEPPHAD